MQVTFMMELLFVVVTLQLLVACHGQPPCDNEVRITPESQAVSFGDNVSITCHQTDLQSSGSVAFQWYFLPVNESASVLILQNTHAHRSIHPNASHNTNTLLITNVSSIDLGSYKCERLNPPNCFSEESHLTLFIFKEASISITPKWSSRFTGETLNLTAVVAGNPLPTTIRIAKWDVQAGNYRDYPKTKYFITDLRSIIILDLSLEDNGVYRACVENSHNNIQCAMFTIVVKGLQLIPPAVTIKNGNSLSVVCRVINYNQSDNSVVTWETGTASELANDSLVQITERNASNLHLYVERVTKAVAYSCVLRSRGIMISEYVRLTVTDVPSPPRNLDISANSDGLVTITWKAPEKDNFSPLTAYYVNITIDGGNSTVIRVSLGTTSLEYIAKCKVVNISVTSENTCGNSTAVESSINTADNCGISVNANLENENDDNEVIPAIAAGVAVVVVFAGLFVLVLVVFAILFKRQKQNLKYSTSQKDLESQTKVKAKAQKSFVTASPPPFIKRTTSIRRYRNMLEIPKDNINLRDFLCDGTYFNLRKALITFPDNENKTHEVMVKMAKESAPSEEEHNIQEEIKMMSSVGNHENVVGLLRTCVSEPPAYLITEYFAHGDLLGFLRASRGHYGMYTISPGTGYKTHPCSVQGQDLLKMVTQVAAGMNYLAEKKVTHRSLCARNVLVATGLQVKVYNYGPKANAEVIPHNYDKWMAPEMLFDGTATTMSDVWSFAVTFWEIITIGGSPYATTHPEQMRELLHSGHRLPKPDHCVNELYIIMQQCWSLEPSARPTFTMLYKQLDSLSKSKLSYLDSSLYNETEYSEFEESNQLMTAL